jgi:hypothetical protein
VQAPGKYSQPGSFWRCVAAWQDAAIARDGSAPPWRMAGVGRNTAAQEAAGWPAVAVAAAGDARCAGRMTAAWVIAHRLAAAWAGPLWLCVVVAPMAMGWKRRGSRMVRVLMRRRAAAHWAGVSWLRGSGDDGGCDGGGTGGRRRCRWQRTGQGAHTAGGGALLVVQCYIVTGGSRQGSGGACACTEAWNRRLQVAALRQACHCLWCSAGDVRSGRQQIDSSMQALVRYGPV